MKTSKSRFVRQFVLTTLLVGIFQISELHAETIDRKLNLNWLFSQSGTGKWYPAMVPYCVYQI